MQQSMQRLVPQNALVSETDLAVIRNEAVLVECEVSRMVFGLSSQHFDRQHQQAKLNVKGRVVVQIQISHIVVFNSDTQKILMAFRPSLYHTFEVIKNQETNQQGMSPRGIRFTLADLSPSSFTFHTENKSQIQTFIKVMNQNNIMKVFDKKQYKPIQLRDKGATARISTAQDSETGQIVAIRAFRRNKVTSRSHFKTSFLNEVSILKWLKDPLFCQTESICTSDRSIYMIMEYLPINLYQHLLQRGFPQYNDCKTLLRRLAQGVQKLHSFEIMHRDIKLKNIMLRNGSITDPVIIDFGLALKGRQQAGMKYCGTPGFIAPEVLSQHSYDKKCDIFSLGAVFHYLLLGKMVFQGETSIQILRNNYQSQIDLEFRNHPAVPPDMRSLLKGMFTKQPQDRLTAEQVVGHDFFLPFQ